MIGATRNPAFFFSVFNGPRVTDWNSACFDYKLAKQDEFIISAEHIYNLTSKNYCE